MCVLKTNSVLATKNRNMTKEEIKQWIGRWSKLKPSPQRDMVIRIWSKLTQKKIKNPHQI